MRIVRFILIFAYISCMSLMGQAQFSGETEFTQDLQGGQVYDLYVFLSGKSAPLVGGNPVFVGRYTRAEKSVHRGEFGFGKKFLLLKDGNEVPQLVVTVYPGVTTDKAGMSLVVFVARILERTVVYVPDAKFFSGSKTLYQEVSAGLTRKGSWQFRWETLDLWGLEGVGHVRGFNRFGLERRFWVPCSLGSRSHFHISVFYDTEKNGPGTYAGFRWQ